MVSPVRAAHQVQWFHVGTTSLAPLTRLVPRRTQDKSVDCGFFQWVDSGNSRGEDCFAELTYANASLKIKVEELETSLVTAKAKAARRKREYHDMHERAARLADDCVGLVAEIRNIRSVLTKLERHVSHLTIAFVIVLSCCVFILISVL
ncbi:hypothetical protein LINPERHAP1_LOCUS1641 [Linum perenne]